MYFENDIMSKKFLYNKYMMKISSSTVIIVVFYNGI